jgi:GNAT superfamily N-acetyltransferase
MSESAIRLRDATAADADAIASLLAELGHPAASADVPARLAAIRNEHGAVLLAVDDADTPLGLMSLSRHVTLHARGPIASITALVTASSARRRGVGERLVDAAKKWAVEQGCVRLSVTSAERRSDAHAFYPACGLPYTGRRFAMEIATER